MNKHIKFYVFILFSVLFPIFGKAQPPVEKAFLRADSLCIINAEASIKICDSVLSSKSGNNKKWKGIFSRIRGKAYYFKGKYEEAAHNYTRSITVLEQTGEKRELGITFIEQAKLFRKLKMFPQAIETYLKAETIFNELNDKSNLSSVWNEWGVVYELMKDYDKAIAFYKKSLQIKESLKDMVGIAYSNGFLSTAYMLKEDYQTAERYGKKSMDLFRLLGDDFATALQSSDIAMIYRKKKQYTEAIRYLKYSDSIAHAMKYTDLLSENYRKLSEVYSDMSDYKNAYRYHQKYAALKDSLFSNASQKNIAELHVQYETAKKDNQILQQENRYAKQRLYSTITVFLLLLTMALAFFIYRTRKLKEDKLKKEAFMQAELLKMEAQNTLQNDRLRISRDLHDNIGANLTFIHTNLTDIKPNDEHQNEQWSEVKTMLNETITELRRTVWLINRSSVSLEEWIVKLREYYRRVQKVIIISEAENHERILSSKEATALLRIVQEAVNNALKHADPSEIKVKITPGNSGLTICITDDGKGFAFEKTDGFGLGNMKQNAEEIGGTLRIESVLGKGTKIEVHIPKDTK